VTTNDAGHDAGTVASRDAGLASPDTRRRYGVGAEMRPGGQAHVRVWAPRRQRVELVLESQGNRTIPLTDEGNGYASGLIDGVADGDLYRLRLDGGDALYPDPASRFQPEGPHGPSQLVDPRRFVWTDASWRGVPAGGPVIYEMHIGTFTRDGTWAAAMAELPALAELGITVLEVMPVAEFPGRFGWGYDGVDMFAPTRLYGQPDDFRRFVDGAHGLGLAVILDVVYNHFGPDGCYVREFSDTYISSTYENEWGDALNFDGPGSGPVREFFLANAACWIEEYHLDGLRLDATQQIFDASPTHLVTGVTRTVRATAQGRATFLVGENEPQDIALARPVEIGGHGLDALWNDDFHHSAMVALTGRGEAYYTDYRGTPQEFISTMKYGFLYQGQWYAWQKKPRGTASLDMPPTAFVTFLQNHDQVANSGCGLRLHALTSPGRLRALTALMLLGPCTPMLFQGQEFAASAPFLYFADHHPELASLVAAGRKEFLRQFPSLAAPDIQATFADPADPQTFLRCKLDHGERESHAPVWRLHRDLLRLRRDDRVFSARRRGRVDGAVLAAEALVLRFFDGAGEEDGPDNGDRLLIVNLGRDLVLSPAPEPLLAPPAGCAWRLLWSSEDPAYGGCGTPGQGTFNHTWRIPGHAALAFGPGPRPAAGTPSPPAQPRPDTHA
jgi:maltooligosyltrehalose trehalohydrolase